MADMLFGLTHKQWDVLESVYRAFNGPPSSPTQDHPFLGKVEMRRWAQRNPTFWAIINRI